MKKIKLPDRMTSKAAKSIFALLEGNKKEAKILFVGGCVRNALLDENIHDMDLATVWTPQEITKKLNKTGIKVIPTGIKHGTVTAILNHEAFQITTLRRDIETDGRHAKVAYTDNWAEDASRRDFTLNTLLADIEGNIYDPLGSGLSDLEKRKIIFVGDAETRIKEDYLRILRFFRFHAWYGKGKPHQKGLNACIKLARGMKTLSKERVTQEIFKILLSPMPQILKIMFENNILKSLFHSKADINLLASPLIENNLEAGLLVIGNFSETGTRRIENELRLTNNQKKQLDMTVFYLKKFKAITENELKILLYRSGHKVARLVLVSRLLLMKKTLKESLKWISELERMERPVLPMRGQDLIDQGMRPGPEIKHALNKFETLWIKRGFR